VEDIAEDVLLAAQEELSKRREEALKDGRELTEEEMADLVRFNPKTEIMLSEAKKINKKIKVGEILKIDLEVSGDFGRMAAQTAKQVVIQRLREAERNTAYEDLKDQAGSLIHGIVQRRDREGNLLIDLGKVTGIVPLEEQIQGEFYKPGSRLRFLILSVEMGKRGLEIKLSRSSNKMIETIFSEEIPEVAAGSVVIKGIARDPGHRAKVAVFTDDESIDPIGACIGQRGSRITTIITELGGEKIDVITFNENAEAYIKNSLSPAKVQSVKLNEDAKEADVHVAADQYSLAIGRGGQNVRLASDLTGWKLNVVSEGPLADAHGEVKALVEEQAGVSDGPKVEETAEEKKD
jgi:N utilization substance protein A